MNTYVHGYTERERERLHDQANTLAELLHHDTRYPAGGTVLEVGCGVGAQMGFLAANSPGARFTSMDSSAPSLAKARARIAAERLNGFRLCRGDLYRMPFGEGAFDHAFVCFVLEHLAEPLAALRAVLGAVKPGGTLTAIEGDHGSCYFHPETDAARQAWNCLIRVQAGLGGDSLIGRRLYPLLRGAGLERLTVTRRDVYCDESRPQWMDGFVKKTIIPMVEGVKEQALAEGMIDEATWVQGIRDLHATGTPPEGVFCYTFFKGVGVKPG
jgi:SAM-dependent methyltransferase